MFRRRATLTEDEPQQAAAPTADAETATAARGKGRPTPKRREAERYRRTYVQAPKDRKEAARLLRDRQRSDRQEQGRALRGGGDERRLPARDRGPVRALVRDVVDARRGIGGYFLFATFGILLVQLLMSWLGNQAGFSAALSARLQLALMYVWYAGIVLVAVDSYLLVRTMKRVVAERHPDASERGLGMYAVTRSLQIRRLRLPKPRVKPGAEI